MSKADNGSPRQIRSIKNTLIEPFSQLKIGIYVIIVTVVFLVLSGLLFYNSFSEQYNNVLEIFNITDPDSKWQLISNDVFYSNLIKLSLLFLLFIAVLLSVIFYSTHKYYGPLMSFQRFSTAITEGKYYSRVQVRKKDELQLLAEQLNSMASTLEKKHGSLVDELGNSVRRRKADSTKIKTPDSSQLKKPKDEIKETSEKSGSTKDLDSA